MLRRVVRFSLEYRGVVLAFACTFVAYGIYAALHSKVDVFPEFAAPQVVVQTEAPGFSADQVETLVTRPIENALNGMPGLDSIRSESIQGLSAITVVFSEDVDIFRVRQAVSERLLESARRLPAGIEAPAMGALTSSTSLVLAVGITSDVLSAMELRTLADWQLRPVLLGEPGVGQIEIFGGEVRQLQIQVNPQRLVAHDLTIADVADAARSELEIRGAGFAETPAQRIVVRSGGQARTAAELAGRLLRHDGKSAVRFADVATVQDGAEPKFGAALIQGREGVLLLAHAQYGANTLDVTHRLEEALARLGPSLRSAGIELHPRMFRPATFIEKSLSNIRMSLVVGGFLVGVVLFLFLLDVRTAFISFTAIPVSLLGAIVVLDLLGISLNTITLGGLAISVGVVVDDAIIDVENTVRRLRGDGARESALKTILDASIEVRSSIVYATFIVALVFLPVLTMSGVQGRLFAPLAQAFVLATMFSLLVALTITPALCMVLLADGKPGASPAWVERLAAAHRRFLRRAFSRPAPALLFSVAIVVASAAALPFFGGEFLPEFHEGHLIVHMTAAPGTSLPESIRLGQAVTADLMENPHVRSVAQQSGRAELGEDTWGTNLSEFHVELAELTGQEAAGIADELRESVRKFPAATFDVMTSLAERIEETLSGANAQFVVEIYSEDLDALDEVARAVRDVLGKVRGAVDVQVESEATAPEVSVKLRPDALLRYGFRSGEVLEQLQAVYEGIPVGQVFEGERVSDAVVRIADVDGRDPHGLGSVMISTASGTRVPLGVLASIATEPTRSLIVHHGARRRQQVTCNVSGRDAASFLREAKERIGSSAHLPAGASLEYSGSAVAAGTARRDLLIRSFVAAAGILLLLAIVFHGVRNLLLVLANLPFALAGGVLAVALTGGDMSVGTLVGFVALFGITMRNSIMLVSHYGHLVRNEGHRWSVDTAILGASERMTPVLMTALITALGLLPVALSSGHAGHEIEAPMAIVILGGLASSTILNLLVLPVAALRYGRFGEDPRVERLSEAGGH